MRILMVSPYPPIRDGIASYAVQEVAALLDAGHEVEVISPWPSAAHHHLALRGPRGPLALAKRMGRYDRVIVQYHADVFYPLPLEDRERTRVTAALLVAFGRHRNVEVRVHEFNYGWALEPGMHGRMFRALWRLPAKVTVHTDHELQLMADAVGRAPDRIEVRDHGASFVPRVGMDRAEARARLGIDEAAHMFLAIGFIQPHKGFDRAVRAFDGLADHGCRIDVVGSVRVDEPAFRDYAADLRRLVDATRGAHLHEEYVSDEMFDLWLVAADALVLPYRHIWSSGVLQRAAIYGTPVIATRVGGLEHQRHGSVRLVEDDAELALAMRECVGAPIRATERERWRAGEGFPVVRSDVQEAVRQRASVLAETSRRAGETLDASAARILRTTPPLELPPTSSNNPVAAAVKRFVRRLTFWELEPVVERMNALQRAVVDHHDERDDTLLAEIQPDDPGTG